MLWLFFNHRQGGLKKGTEFTPCRPLFFGPGLRLGQAGLHARNGKQQG